MNSTSLISNYLNDTKKIKCTVIKKDSDFYNIYEIILTSLQDVNKFNKRLELELKQLLQDNFIKLTVNNKITITTKKEITQTIYKSDFNKITLGLDQYNNFINWDIQEHNHLLIGGASGSGKSVFLNCFILQMLEKNQDEIALAMIDLKQVELIQYKNIKQQLYNIALNPDEAIKILNDIINIIQIRYKTYKGNNVVNITEYNQKNYNKKHRHIYLIIDEFADLMIQNKKDTNTLLTRILQLGRACGVHVILATQRPSNDILSGLIKNNFVNRICFKVGNRFDSTTILNTAGAEKLNGKGDALYLDNNNNLTRVHALMYPDLKKQIILSKNEKIKENIIDKFKILFK